MKELVKSYIIHTIQTPNVLNKFVPNSHIGITISEVYEFIEYYECGEHTELFEHTLMKYKGTFNDMVLEVFSETELNDTVVHEAYQRLRENHNTLRNFMKLIMIYDTEQELMCKRINRGPEIIYKEITQTTFEE
jgi:hypothetical protein